MTDADGSQWRRSMTIEEYIACPKVIERKRRPAFKAENRHYRMDIDLVCPDCSNVKMSMFLRKSMEFNEDFTVGLRLEGPNEYLEHTIVILRYQGPHGGQSDTKTMKDLHNSFHIHEYTATDAQCRRKKASYKGAAGFGSFEEAIVQFLKRCNISDPNGIFDEEREAINQIRMDLDI